MFDNANMDYETHKGWGEGSELQWEELNHTYKDKFRSTLIENFDNRLRFKVMSQPGSRQYVTASEVCCGWYFIHGK